MRGRPAGQNGAGVPASGNVSLPVDEYNRLLEMAAKPTKGPDAPPVAYIIRNALNLVVQGETAVGSVSLEGEVFAGGARQGAAGRRHGGDGSGAQRQGPAAPARGRGRCKRFSRDRATSRSACRRRCLFKVETQRASVNLVAPAAGAVRLILSVPGEETLVQLNPGLITRHASAGGRTIITGLVGPGPAGEPLMVGAPAAAAAPAVPKETRFTFQRVVEDDRLRRGIRSPRRGPGRAGQSHRASRLHFRAQLPAGFRLVNSERADAVRVRTPPGTR